MFWIFELLFQQILEGAQEVVNNMLGEFVGQMLKIEELLAGTGSPLDPTNIAAAYKFIYTLAGSLVLLKFLYKGFQIYILWRDGDADVSPQGMLIGLVQAVVVIVSFPYLYDIMADVTEDLAGALLSILGVTTLGGSEAFRVSLANYATNGIVFPVLLIVYLVMVGVLYVRMIKLGFELLILRLGVPFACAGFIDSDYGIWKSYMKAFFQADFTAVIQVVLLSVSIGLANGAHLFLAFAAVSTAFGAPRLMQQFMVSGGGGGSMTQKIYSAGMVVRALGILKGG